MIVFVLLAVTAVPVIIGFIRTQRQRGETRRRRAAFFGFSAALAAVTMLIATTAVLCRFGPVKSRYVGSVPQGALFAAGIIATVSTVVAFACGFFAERWLRIFLIVFGPVMVFIYVLLAFWNFGA